MLRSIAELVAYGMFAALLTAASLAPEPDAASSATTRFASTTSPSTDGRLTNEPAPAVTSDRGAILFAVKGCVGCHIHSALPSSRMKAGPDLSSLAERAGTRVAGLDARAYVRQSLRDPRAFVAPGYGEQMPELRLTEEEIESLTGFLLSPKR